MRAAVVIKTFNSPASIFCNVRMFKSAFSACLSSVRKLTSRLSSLPALFSSGLLFGNLVLGVSLIDNRFDHFAYIRSQ